MPEPLDDSFEQRVRHELARIGLGGGINLGGAFTPEQLLQALRATPDGAGGQALFTNLAALLPPNDAQ